MPEYRRYYKLQRYNKDGTPYEPPMYKKGPSIEQHWWPSLESCELNHQIVWEVLNNEFICEKTENNSYISYQKLQAFIDGVPYQPEEFKKGDRVGDVEYNSLENCEKQIYIPMNCFSWTPSTNGMRMTLNGLNYNIDKEQHNGYCFGDDIQTLRFKPYSTDQYIETINFTSINTENCTDISHLFKNQPNLTSVDLTLFNTSKVEDMNQMFSGCTSLTSVNLSSFDTSSVLNMNSMFNRCKSLKNLNLSSFDVQNTTYMKFMFQSCSALTDLNVSNFNMVAGVHNGINNDSMFSGCTSLNHITCKQSFKDWCWKYQNSIGLPTAMREGGTGTWTIVD